MMKRILVTLLSILVLCGAAVGGAEASGGFRHHGPRAHFGVYLGNPYWWGPGPYWRTYPPYWYYDPPAVVIQQQQPPVYIQREPKAQSQPSPMWYYCPNPAGYYPYVQSCPQQWVPVDPRSVPATPPSGPAR